MALSALKITQNEIEPRLTPIEKPKSFKLKLAYWLTKKKLGRVITPLKVHYSRFPGALGLVSALTTVQNRFTIDQKLQHLIQVYTSTVNGCAFCVDLGRAHAQQNKMDTGLFDDLLRFEESNRYTAAEKAALTYVKEVNLNKHVSDEVFERLQHYYNEEEIIQITMRNAIENFYNYMNAPLNIGSDELCELMSSQ